MSDRHRFSFSINGSGHGEVLMDGKPVNVTAIEVRAAAGEATRVVLTFNGVDIDTDVEAELMKHHAASEEGDLA